MNKTNGTYVTLKEASLLTGKSCSTVYRLGKSKLIPWKRENINGNYEIMFDRFGLIEFFSNYEKPPQENKSITKNEIKEVIEEFFETKQTQLMKPLEQEAIYRVGKLETENRFLKERLETIIEENKDLREQFKSLPGPAEKIKETIKKIKTENMLLKEELRDLPCTPKEVNKKFLQNKDNIEKLQSKNSELEEEQKILIEDLKKRENYMDLQEEKLKEMEEKLKLEEKEKLKIVQKWKERVEELELPWWKKFWRRSK